LHEPSGIEACYALTRLNKLIFDREHTRLCVPWSGNHHVVVTAGVDVISLPSLSSNLIVVSGSHQQKPFTALEKTGKPSKSV
jgi:hypothetical protein